MSTSGDETAPRTVIGDFELGREIGRGGMGTVYEAWQRSLQRTVAVKVLSRQVSSTATAVLRFQREAQAAARLHHTHIVPIFDQGEDSGVYYYAMELVDGRGLNAVIAENRERQAADTATSDLADTLPLNRPVPNGSDELDQTTAVSVSDAEITADDTAVAFDAPPEVCTSAEHFTAIAGHMAAVADALDYAHQHGIVHRDIKPHNLILGNDGRMRISDFGLARLSEQPGVTITGEMLGSPLYMSPEQIRGGPIQVDHRTDIYSLGATMYEWITLQPPYPGETREQVISRILTSEPQPLRAHNPAVPVDLETICLKAIEPDRERRYRNAAELRDDLQRFLDKRPIKAKRAGMPVRIGKLIARHQVASLAAAAAVVAAVLGYAVVSKQGQVETQTAAAEEARQAAANLAELISRLPLELGGPLRAAGAAVPMLEGVARGPDTAAVSAPERIAQRAVGDFYDAITAARRSATGATATGEFAGLFNQATEQAENDPEAALQFVSDYLEAHPGAHEARQLELSLYGRFGQYGEMLADAERLVRVQPDQANAYVWRALASLLLGNAPGCRSDLNHATQLGGSPAWVSTLRGLTLAGEDGMVEASSAFDDALFGEPDLIVALLGRASARKALGNLVGAITDLTRVLQLEPDNADVLTLRGDHHIERGDFLAAERDYEKAMNLIGQAPSIVMRLVFAMSQRMMAVDGRESASGEDSKAGNGTAEPPDQSSGGSVLDWFSRQLRP